MIETIVWGVVIWVLLVVPLLSLFHGAKKYAERQEEEDR